VSYVVVFRAKEARSSDDSIVTSEDEQYLVVSDEGGWVEASSTPYRDGDELDEDARTFRTEQSADRFMSRWEGHPWYAVPKSWQIRRVRRVTRPQLVGYKFVD
jgi:hypothetical protein